MERNSVFHCPRCHEAFDVRGLFDESMRSDGKALQDDPTDRVLIVCPHCPANLIIDPVAGSAIEFSEDGAAAIAGEQQARTARGDEPVTMGIDLIDLGQSRQRACERITRGNIHKNNGDVHGAIAEYRKALEIRKWDPDAHHNLGVCLLEQGDLTGAANAFRNAVRVSRDAVLSWSNLGMILLKTNNADEAEACFDAAIVADPAYPKSYVGKGNCALLRGDRVSARQAFQLALERDPSNAAARAALNDIDTSDSSSTGLPKDPASIQKLIKLVTQLQANPDQSDEILRRAGEEDPELLKMLRKVMQRGGFS